MNSEMAVPVSPPLNFSRETMARWSWPCESSQAGESARKRRLTAKMVGTAMQTAEAWPGCIVRPRM